MADNELDDRGNDRYLFLSTLERPRWLSTMVIHDFSNLSPRYPWCRSPTVDDSGHPIPLDWALRPSGILLEALVFKRFIESRVLDRLMHGARGPRIAHQELVFMIVGFE